MLRRSLLGMLPASAAWLWAAPSKNVIEIAPGVWFRRGFCNSAIVEMPTHLVLIDSGMNAAAEALAADCRAVSAKPVRYVFLTHHHFDHVEANAFWTAHGATTLAFKAVAEELRREKRPFQEPRQLIEGDSYVLAEGARKLEFHHYGWAHTKGDGFAYLPAERILFSGDAVLNGPFNSFMNANARNWIGVLKRVAELDVRHVLPGHGEPGGKDLIGGQREFLEALVAGVGKAVAEGKKLEDIVEMRDGRPYRSKLEMPASVAKWAKDRQEPKSEVWPMEGPISGNQVRFVYAELSAAKAGK